MALKDVFEKIPQTFQYRTCQFLVHFLYNAAASQVTFPAKEDRIAILEKTLTGLGLMDFDRQGAGVYTFVLRAKKTGDANPDKVVRLSYGADDHYAIPQAELEQDDLFLPVEERGSIDPVIGGTYEIVSRAAIVGEPEFDFMHHPLENAFYAGLILHARGSYYWQEPREDNVGVHNGRVVIIDPGAIRDRPEDLTSVKAEMMAALQHCYAKIFNDRFKECVDTQQSGMQVFERFIAISLVHGDNGQALMDKASQEGLAAAQSFDKDKPKLFIFDTTQERRGLDIVRSMGLGAMLPAAPISKPRHDA